MRAHRLPGLEDPSALEVLIMHSDTPETGQKSRFFNLWSLIKRYKLSKIYFGYRGVCPKLIAARKRRLHHYLALSQ